jgi:hypothetical protein
VDQTLSHQPVQGIADGRDARIQLVREHARLEMVTGPETAVAKLLLQGAINALESRAGTHPRLRRGGRCGLLRVALTGDELGQERLLIRA